MGAGTETGSSRNGMTAAGDGCALSETAGQQSEKADDARA